MTSGYLRLFRLATECLPPSRGRAFSEAANRSLEAQVGGAGSAGTMTHAQDSPLGFPGAPIMPVSTAQSMEPLWPLDQAHGPEFVPHTDLRRESVSSSTYRPEVGPLSQVRLPWNVAICLIVHSSIQQTSILCLCD